MTFHYDPLRTSAVAVEVGHQGSRDRFLRATSTRRPGIYRNGGKRVLDVALVLLAAPILLMTVAILAVFVARDGGQPFYSQARVGRNGRVYRMWKLRSMVKDADSRLEAHLAANPEARAEWDSTQKLKQDPRITRFGQLLRRSSLDELPQFWNVFTGEMSIVGPRPMMPCQQAIYPGAAYYRTRPGITGSWQVTDRNESSFAQRAGFDHDYERSISLLGDIRIILSTFRVVMRGTGY